MDNSTNRHTDHLGVNKIGKNIRKSPLHQPNFSNGTTGAAIAVNAARQQPQPQVYNISKNDFRNIVQQLTGSPAFADHMSSCLRDNENFSKLFCKRSSSACSEKPPHKSTELDSGFCPPAVQEALSQPRIITSSISPPYKSTKLIPGYCPPAVQEGLLPSSRAKTSSARSHEQLNFTWRTGSECAICGGQLSYVFRGKGFATCQQCFDSSSS